MTFPTRALLHAPLTDIFANSKTLPTCSFHIPLMLSSSPPTPNYANPSQPPRLVYQSLAFIASPAKPDGWIGWGINPNDTGMVGAQVILALKSSKGAPEVKTYNLVAYSDIREEKLSFDVWDLSAETNATSGEFTIFASVKVQEKTESVNHIWQVGAAVNKGKPGKHEFAADNKDAKATLKLTAAAQKTGKTAATTTPASGSSSTNATAGGKSGSFRIKEMNVGFCFAVFVLLASFIGF
ncbi:hypothetical protein DKX38_003588 [Salix brachista]|uniref:DOMON domain-containing protein n=1 Tax=Salix brachista TaxID=2182728 RepID=A0A5N5NQC9_9ROSI|nr:hypothetical protein DKX38_003588 [Salix brachista]